MVKKKKTTIKYGGDSAMLYSCFASLPLVNLQSSIKSPEIIGKGQAFLVEAEAWASNRTVISSIHYPP